MQARAEWIDQLKGLGIIAVVMGHHQSLMQLLEIRDFIYSWHMPLFFALSGMTLSGISRHSIFIRLGSLLWVYVAVSLALLPIGLLVFKNIALHYDGTIFEKFVHAIYGILYGSTHTIRVGPLWFIPCLILSMAGACISIQAADRIKEERQRLAFLFAASLLHLLAGSYFLNSLKTPDHIWRLDWGTISENGYFFTANVAPLAMGFVIFGAFVSRLFRFLTNNTIAYLSIIGGGDLVFYILHGWNRKNRAFLWGFEALAVGACGRARCHIHHFGSGACQQDEFKGLCLHWRGNVANTGVSQFY